MKKLTKRLLPLALLMPATLWALPDDLSLKLEGITSDCRGEGGFDHPVCEALALRSKGRAPRGKERMSRDVRFVDVAYLKTGKGKYRRQMVAVAYRYSRNFHEKLYYPNRLCAFFVDSENPKEQKIIDEGIERLEKGEIPETNRAYRWGMKHKIEEKHCRSFRKSPDGTHLISSTGNWELRESDGHYIFSANRWGKEEADMILAHKK